MKTVSVPTDWLNEINGRSVAYAIAYLSTLPSDHKLDCWRSNSEGYGVEIGSELTYERPYTEQAEAKQPATAIACGIPGMAKTTCPYCDQEFAFEYT